MTAIRRASCRITMYVRFACCCTCFLYMLAIPLISAQSLPESDFPAPIASSYIVHNGSHFLFSRCPREKGWRTSDSIEIDCWCWHDPTHDGPISSPPYCPHGIQCRRTFGVLDQYGSLDAAIMNPFGDQVLLWSGNVHEGEVCPFVDAEIRKPFYPYLDSLFISSLSPLQPPIRPRAYTYAKCAVVGQSAILRGAGYGPKIDDSSYDAVFRMNENAVDNPAFYADLGTRADFWMFSGQYSIAALKSKGIIDRIRKTGAKIIFLWNQMSDYRKIITIKREFPDVELYALHPQYWWWWCAHRTNLYPEFSSGSWEEYFLTGFRLTSMTGTVSAMMALQSCRSVDLYGFYGLVHAPNGMELEHHYDAGDREKRENLSVRLDLEMLFGLSTLSDAVALRELRIYI